MCLSKKRETNKWINSDSLYKYGETQYLGGVISHLFASYPL